MPRLNIGSPEFQYDADDPEGFRAGMFRFGPQLGAKDTGSTVYELPPGQAICPYHYEYAEEEWLLVLEGTPDAAHARGRGADRAVGDGLLPDRPRGRALPPQRDRRRRCAC